MKRITITLTVVVLIVISLIISYFLPNDYQQYISNFATLISLCATIITLIIAMILYNQFGLDQTILEKKSEVVFKLLDLLNERSFVVQTNIGYHPLIWLTSISRNKRDYGKNGNIKLLFNTEYINYIQPIINLSNSVFLPTEILPKIQYIEPSLFGSMKDKVNDVEYALVVVTKLRSDNSRLISEIDDRIDKNDWGTLLLREDGRTEITLSEFIQQWDDLIITSTKWLSKYSSFQDLNIPFFRNYRYANPKRPVIKKIWDWLMADAF